MPGAGGIAFLKHRSGVKELGGAFWAQRVSNIPKRALRRKGVRRRFPHFFRGAPEALPKRVSRGGS